jgi:hypothetical protein
LTDMPSHFLHIDAGLFARLSLSLPEEKEMGLLNLKEFRITERTRRGISAWARTSRSNQWCEH